MDLWSFADQLAVSSLRKRRQSARVLKDRKKNRGYFRDHIPRTDHSISQKNFYFYFFFKTTSGTGFGVLHKPTTEPNFIFQLKIFL